MGWRGWLGVACLLFLGGTRSAFAHAVLLSTDPSDGATLRESPRGIAFRFNEPVQWLEVKVLDASGTSLATPAEARSMTPELSVAPRAPLRPGAYWVTYRVVSADSHVISGAFAFAISGPSGTPAPSELSVSSEVARVHGMEPSSWAPLVIANRAAQLAGALVAIGIALYLLFVRGMSADARRDLRGMAYAFALLAGATSIVAFGLQGGIESGASPKDGLFHIEPWIQGAGSRRALASTLMIAGLLIIGAGGLPRKPLLSRALFGAGTLVALASFTIVGHAANTLPRLPAVAAWLIHLCVAAFWLGSLLALMKAVRADHKAAVMLTRFSRIAAPAVVLLAAAGAGIAVLQIASWNQLASSSYGQVLLLKVALFCVMLVFAAINRFVLLPRLIRRGLGSGHAITRALTVSIAMEVSAGMLILVLAALLAQQVPPSRNHTGSHAESGSQTMPADHVARVVDAGGRSASIRLKHPGERDRSQPGKLAVVLRDARGQSLQPLEVTVDLSSASLGNAPIQRVLRAIAPGEFQLEAVELHMSKRWRIRLQVLINDFEETQFETEAVFLP